MQSEKVVVDYENAPGVIAAPLTEGQQQLWILAQRDDNGSRAYNVPLALRLRGALDDQALCGALNDIVEHHEALRTVISADGLAQQILPAIAFHPSVIDLSGLATPQRERQLNDLLRSESSTLFDLATGPLFRAAVIKLEQHHHVLALVAHHIIVDGWSMGVLVRDIGAAYTARLKGARALEVPPLQFREYADWLEAHLDDASMQPHEAYWLEQLAAPLPNLELPTYEQRPPLMSFRGARQSASMGAELVRRLNVFSQQENCTLFMTLLAGYLVLLHRLTGQDDVIVGVPVTKRALKGGGDLVGYCVNIVPVRGRVSKNMTFRAYLGKLRDTLIKAYQHADYTFARLVNALDLPRDPSRPLLVATTFNMNPPLPPGLEMPGLELELIQPDIAYTRHDLSVNIIGIERDLLLEFEYNTDLFDSATARRFAGRLVTLFESVLADPQEGVAKLPILTDVERHTLLVDWNATKTDYPRGQCLHELFEAQVAKTPEATAVVFEKKSLTYAELNARANQLANCLRTLSVGPDVPVGVFMERSLEMVVGLYGILKAAGAYVPLDPDYPAERLAFMLEDILLPVVLTQSYLEDRLPPTEARVVALDTQWEAIAQESEHTPSPLGESAGARGSGPQNLAYVIFTSGSTGWPKGVGVPQEGIVNRLQWMQAEYGLDTTDRVLQKTPFSFDVSVWEFFWPLITGARLVVAKPDGHKDSAYLVDLIAEQQITTLHFVPPMLAVFLEEPAIAACTSLRRVICSGEALPAELMQRHGARLDVPLHNLYGPTEASVDVSYWACDPDTQLASVPIGRPVANTQLYILDTELNPVPVGVAGELYIGGVQLARGYLNRPALTAEKFIPNPFSQTLGARLYRTGDLARYRPDGNIEFLGRIDHQVKVRGFRIELGEIEATLSQHPQVREAVMVAREDSPGDKRLVAYVVGISKEWPEIHALRSFLKDKLPDYMVPAAFVFLDSLPLSPNGKVDRKALPAPEAEGQLALDYVAPRTPTEEILAAIWAEVLGVERVGIRDNFFELGGHSLLVTQVVSRIRAAFEVELPLRVLFEAPAVAELAHAVDAVRQAEAGLQAPPIEPISRDAAPPLSFAQQRLWFLDQLKPNDPFYNMPGVVRLQGALDAGEALARSLNALIERHEALRTTFATVDGAAVQVIAPELKLTLAVIDLTELPEEAREAQARRLAAEEAQQSFDLAEGPLVRACLLRLAEEDHLLQVTLHHIVADGWSLGIFVNELAALYRAFEAGQPSPLPLLPVQYADFAHWQRQWLQGEVLDQQLGYWREQLEGLPALLELPTDRPRPPVQSFHGAHYPITVSSELTQMLRRLSRGAGVTLFMTLLAAFQVLLARYTGQRDFAVGTPIANRNRAETEGLIGFFVNTLVLRADLADNPRLSDLLARTKEITLGAYAHQDVPFERLVDALQPERDMSHSPLFQVMFALQNAPLQPADLPGLKLTPWTLESGTAKFDLTLELAEEGEGLVGNLEYNTDLFDQTTIERLSGHLLILLEGITQVPQARVSELPLLTAAERQQLLVDWNATQTDFPQDQCIHQLFEAQVENTPAATAVVFEDQTLTYAELNVRANQLAHYLRTVGVGPDTLVGLCVERSPEMIIGLLGILKAGGAYVPLDPAYPEERLAFMLEDSQASLVLTQAGLTEALPARAAMTICLDRDWPAISRHSKDNPVNQTQPEHLAYVIYTSGTTGRPKGTSIVHRSVVRLVRETNYARLTADEVFLQLAPISFDASTFEIWGSLLNAARLVIFPPHKPTLEELGQAISAHGITTLWLTAGLFHLMVDQRAKDLRKLRQLLVGGDVLSVPHVRAVLRGFGDNRVINGYGPTESTTFTCCHSMTADSQPGDSVPIGRPIANTQVYVLDPAFIPVPVGVTGELHIGGVGLARGYLNRPDLTAERFIPNPFSQVPGERLYKTGDQARYRPDGNIEFLGRIDHQIKLRGFRIELGEIEAVLAQNPAVQAAVAVVREDSPGDKRLVAYVVASSNSAPDVNAMRAFLKQKLPGYMVPAAFVILDALPLTPNGKIDRKALPAPDARPALAESYVPPRNPTEQRLADIWAELLRVERVGIHDNFFELGGDSILGIQIISRASLAGLELTARQLFENQTVAGLAGVAGTTREIKAEQGLVTGHVPLTAVQHWFFERELPVPQHFNQSVLLEVHEPLDPVALKSAVEHLSRHHDALRMRFEQAASGWRQTNAEQETSEIFTEANLASQSAPEQAAALEAAATQLQASLGISHGPLLRTALFRMGPDRPDLLLLIVHHLVVDGVSWRILIEDLYAAYRQLQAGQPLALPPKTTSFKEWAEQLQAYAQADRAREELGYWSALAENPFTSLPVDIVDGANTFATSHTVSLSLSPEETRALLKEAPEAYGTQINDLLLTALVQTLSSWNGGAALWVDLEGHGREPFSDEQDVSRTVGWFTALFPICLDLNGVTETGAAIKAIKEQLRSAPRKGVGYGLLRYLASAETRVALEAMPAPEVCFNYLGQFDQVMPDSPFRLARENRGAEHHADEPNLYRLHISGMVTDDQLVISWTYSEQLYHRETIERLAQGFAEALRALIDHCLSPEAGGYTPSDFTDVDFEEGDLEELLAEYESAQD